MDDLEVQAAPADPGQLGALATLLGRSYPRVTHLRVPFLEWSYLENPEGVSLSIDAHLRGRLVGHVGFSPMRALLHGEVERGFLVHTIATDPDFEHRGIFTRLLETGVAFAGDQGCAFIVSVPNHRSVGVFTSRCEFGTLGTLSVRLGLGRPPLARLDRGADFERLFTPDELRWRLARPGARYGATQIADGLRIEVDTGTLGICGDLAQLPSAVAELSGHSLPGSVCGADPVHLSVGLEPGVLPRAWPSVNLPVRVRPAPLHFVYRDLGAPRRVWSRDRVRFRLIDFDAY